MLLPAPRHAPGLSTLSEDELAARLSDVVPTLDGWTRADLLHALFPVPSASKERATPSLVNLAIARVHADGTLWLRTSEFLARRPFLVAQLQRSRRRRFWTHGLPEALIWMCAALVVLVAGLRTSDEPQSANAPKAAAPLLATQATPLPPPLGLLLKERRAKTATQAREVQTRTGVALASVRATAPAARRPHTTVFHNTDFSGYFKKIRANAWRYSHAVAAAQEPSPAPSPWPTVKPRVRPLFDWIFGP